MPSAKQVKNVIAKDEEVIMKDNWDLHFIMVILTIIFAFAGQSYLFPYLSPFLSFAIIVPLIYKFFRQLPYMSAVYVILMGTLSYGFVPGFLGKSTIAVFIDSSKYPDDAFGAVVLSIILMGIPWLIVVLILALISWINKEHS